MVKLADPPPTRRPSPHHHSLPAGEKLVRIYDPAYLEPNSFNYNGPRSRFDHHRAVSPPQHDPSRGIYYAARDLPACVVEVFGDTGVIAPGRYRVAIVEVARELLLLDLTANGAWLAGSVAALTKEADREFSQRWGRYFYEETGVYGSLDGLHYGNAHNDACSYALFERVGSMRVVADMPLSDRKLQGELAVIALELGLVLD